MPAQTDGVNKEKTKCSLRTQTRLGSASKKAGTTVKALEASLAIHSLGRCPGGQQVRARGPAGEEVAKREVL